MKFTTNSTLPFQWLLAYIAIAKKKGLVYVLRMRDSLEAVLHFPFHVNRIAEVKPYAFYNKSFSHVPDSAP